MKYLLPLCLLLAACGGGALENNCFTANLVSESRNPNGTKDEVYHISINEYCDNWKAQLPDLAGENLLPGDRRFFTRNADGSDTLASLHNGKGRGLYVVEW
jgi:hypothetical protein